MLTTALGSFPHLGSFLGDPHIRGSVVICWVSIGVPICIETATSSLVGSSN